MNIKASVMYSVIHKRVFTSLRDLLTRVIEAINHNSNSIMAFAITKNRKTFPCNYANAIFELEELSIASIDIFKSTISDLSLRFPIPRVTHTIRSCDPIPVCQIKKMIFLIQHIGQKQSRRWDFRTYPNFPDRYLKTYSSRKMSVKTPL